MQAIFEWIYDKKVTKKKEAKTHIFLENEGFLGQMVSFNNLFYHKTIKYCISDENTQVKVIYNESCGQKAKKTAKNAFFRRKCVFWAKILA